MPLPSIPRIVSVVLVLGALGCSSSPEPPPATKTAEAPLPPESSPYDVLGPQSRALLNEHFTGDFDEMVKRRLIRAGVVFNRTQYYIDRGVQRGISYESIRLFEEELNTRLNTGLLKVYVAIVPLARDQLFRALNDGMVDFVAATLTITPERQKVAHFSLPTRTGVSEIVVTAKAVPAPATLDDLSGREVFVRQSSSYHESLLRLNESLTRRGKAPVTINPAPEALEDDDILEMVNAGLVEATVVDNFVVEFWQQVFANMVPHPGLALRTNGDIAIGVRKNNPKLAEAINIWIKKYGPKTAFGNMIDRRYLQNANYVRNAVNEAERAKFEQLVSLFEKYGDRYKVDYLLAAAQGFQESRLDQRAKSQVGAIGVMQIMPATGRDLAVGDINEIEPNVHGGVKYFRFMMDEFYKDDPMDELNKGLMTLASYNAGPGRIRQLRAETAKRGLDPNVWFGNVERIVSERIGRETVTYVSNIYKYYLAYKLRASGRRRGRARRKPSARRSERQPRRRYAPVVASGAPGCVTASSATARLPRSRSSSADVVAKRCMPRATMPVHPV
jgi:membrane-bound lytic murein transglycosylase MltF